VATNLNGPFYCTREAFKIMKTRTRAAADHQQRSVRPTRRPTSRHTRHQHAITGLTKATALDGRKYDIACGQIDIGNALTPMAQHDRGVLHAERPGRIEPVFDVSMCERGADGEPAARHQHLFLTGDGGARFRRPVGLIPHGGAGGQVMGFG